MNEREKEKKRILMDKKIVFILKTDQKTILSIVDFIIKNSIILLKIVVNGYVLLVSLQKIYFQTLVVAKNFLQHPI